MKPSLTPRQKGVLAYLKTFTEAKGFPPTLREIARHLGLRGPRAIQKHLAGLEGKGYIRRRAGLSRAIEMTGPAAMKSPPPMAVPVLGRVRAGAPLLAVEEAREHLCLDRQFAPPGAFALTITGDSMIEAGIHDGDYAVVLPKPHARNGEIVVALIGEEATVKRFYKDRDGVRLEPANARMKPILIKPGQDEFRLLGQVVAVIRKLGNGPG
jgi:repressor LexA